MTTDYVRIREENIGEYGTAIERYGRVLLAHLYSDRTHFIYELLQNAEDAHATAVNFRLFEDRLELTHNGRPFNEDDVRGICGLVKGTGADDLTRIGKFGIGFKSVHAYTRSPEVHSGDEHFLVEHYVHPRATGLRTVAEGTTLFVFLFDHEEASPEVAFSEIAARLRKLGSRTLLFLRHINEISWQIDGGGEGTYLREAHIQGSARRVTVIGEGQDEEEEEEWLVFDRPVSPGGDEPRKVEAAFLLERDEEKGEERIVPVALSNLVVFFPTEKETHLGFLIQGPYRTTPARDNVPKDDPSNQQILHATASLIAEALPQIRDMRLLTVSCLEALPIEALSFPVDGMFRPVFEEVREALKVEALLPAHDGGFVAARHAKLARGAALRDLLSSEQLSALYQTQECVQWLAEEITQERTYELHGYLQEELGIEEVTPEDFARRLDIGFLQRQSDEWMARFYGFLSEQEALWRASGWRRTPILLSKPLIRLQGGEHVPPFRAGDAPNVYLPPAEETDFPIVKRAIAEDTEALDFLKKLGLSEPDIVAEIEEKILPKYEDEDKARTISDAEHEGDIQKIFRALGTASAKRKTNLIDRLKSTPFLWAINADTGSRAYVSPPHLYFRSPQLELYFEGNNDVWFVDDAYAQWEDQLLGLGVDKEVRVSCRRADWQGHVITAKEWGLHRRGLDGFDPQTEMDGLRHALNRPSEEKAAYIWNALLVPNQQHIRGIVESSTRQTYEDPKREEKLSPMGRAVCDSPWLVDRSSNFCPPSHLSLDDLPDEFRRDENLAKRLGMKSTSLARVAEEAGVSVEAIEFLRTHREEFEKWRQSRLAESDETASAVKPDEEPEPEEFDFARALEELFARETQGAKPDEAWEPAPATDPSSRRQRIGEEITRGIADEPPREKRFKKVPMTRWEAKDNRVRIFLREEYKGRCQICDDTFTKRNGQPYFEGLYLLSRTDAAWIDKEGNVLCLCATCCAKFQHGSVVADDIIGQITAFRALKEGGDGRAVLRIRLCDEDAEIRFTEKHMIVLQEMVKVSEDAGPVSD